MSKDFFARIRERIRMHVEGKKVMEEELAKKEKKILDNKPKKRWRPKKKKE